MMPSPAGSACGCCPKRTCRPLVALWEGKGAASVGSWLTAPGPARRKRKTRSELPPLAYTLPSLVTATPRKRLAAGVVVTAPPPGGAAGSMTERPCIPPLSDDTTTLPSDARARPMGKRKTGYCVPAGRMHQPAGVVGADPQRSAATAAPRALRGLVPRRAGVDPAVAAGSEAPPV